MASALYSTLRDADRLSCRALILTIGSNLAQRRGMLEGMNGDTIPILEEYAKNAGALIVCPMCHDYLISANDEEAERRAYAIATNALKDGVRGFRDMERTEVVHLMRQVLQRSSDCACSAMMFDH